LKENETKEKGTKEKLDEKPFLAIGIALIIFLILVLGSIIGLKIVRDKINGTGGTTGRTNMNTSNYEVLENGVKSNTSTGVTNAEIDIDNIRFNHFGIVERGEADFLDTDITFDVENMDEEERGPLSFLIRFFDSKEQLITDFTIRIESLPARESIPFRQNLNFSCVDAAKVVVQKIDLSTSIPSEVEEQTEEKTEEQVETEVELETEATVEAE